jgi:hypothetical protein
MTIGTTFNLFAQKLLLNQGRIYGVPNDPLRLVLDCNLAWHWGVRDDKFIADIIKPELALSAQPFRLFDENSDCIVEDQPIWEISNVGDAKSNRRRAVPQPSPSIDSKVECSQWRMERLAYYRPAHMSVQSPDSFGIHFSRLGVLSAIDSVHRLCPRQPREVVALATLYKIFAHEMCHAWIEDICAIMDFSEGNSPTITERRYVTTHERYHGYIFVEEALCNTATYGWLNTFFDVSVIDIEKKSIPAYDAATILQALSGWMKSQPKGYRDFYPITDCPCESDIFLTNLFRLLRDVYGYHDHHISEAISAYFGVGMSPDGAVSSQQDFNRWNCPWIGEPPLHIVE